MDRDLLTVLVDSTVWIDFLRGTNTPHVALLRERLTQRTRIYLAPVILQEVLQGASTPAQFDKWARDFGRLPMLLSSDPVATYREAARLYIRCRVAGVTPRSANDCLIAQTALEHDMPLLARDRDFELIARVEPSLKRVVLPSEH